MAPVAQALQRGRADAGALEAGRQLRSHLAGSMLACYQRTSALEGGLVRILDTSIKMPPLTR